MSLFYDQASPPNGPHACEPVIEDDGHPKFITFLQMVIEEVWTLDGSWTLGPAPTAEDVAAAEIGTVSIRDLRINGGFGPDAVVACGEVTRR